MKTLILVSCVSVKGKELVRAQYLYQSAWFKKARQYAITHGDYWNILSAKHGLLNPDDEVEPYEKTLNTMLKNERLEWSSEVLDNIRNTYDQQEWKIVFLAGARYREFLESDLDKAGYITTVPMRSLEIGQQLAWLTENT